MSKVKDEAFMSSCKRAGGAAAATVHSGGVNPTNEARTAQSQHCKRRTQQPECMNLKCLFKCIIS